MSKAMALSCFGWLLLSHTVLISLLSTTCSCIAALIPAVIVFGDSSVDSGNNNWIPTIAKSNFPPYGQNLPMGVPTGRFCNGRLVSDFASEAFGIKNFVPPYLNPAFGISDFATGVDFASAGTGYDNATSDVLSVIPLWKQIEFYKEYQTRLRNYLGNQQADRILTEALYLTSIGTNDFLENYYNLPTRRRQFTIEQYQDFLVGLAENFLRELYNLGARKISFGGILPMGCLPLERATNMVVKNACQENYNAVARSFNSKLNDLVIKLNRELPSIKLVLANPYPIFEQIIEDPQSYGFTVTGKGCCGTGAYEMGYACNRHTTLVCLDPNTYIFWDAFHPTEKTNQIIVNSLIKNEWSVFFDTN